MTPITKTTVAKYLAALPAATYTVQIAPPHGEEQIGAPIRRTVDAGGIMKMLDFCAAKNAQGFNIFCRPDSLEYILLDDIDAAGRAALDTAGIQPAVVFETSPQNFAAWLRVRPGLTPPEATALATLLAERFGGDPAACMHNQVSRLPGFTNRKQKYRDTAGRYPFVRLSSARPSAIAQIDDMITRAREIVASRAASAGEGEGCGGEGQRPSQLADSDDAALAEIYAEIAEQVGGPSRSEIDFRVALAAERRGYSQFDAERIIAAGTTGAARKAARGLDPERYISTTVARAFDLAARRRVA